MGEEPPESLFMKELRRRGMTPTSLLEEKERIEYGANDEMGKEDRGFSTRNAVSTEIEKSLANQRERSMQLNSEGLEGLIPRARLLLTIGGTFFLGFWPLILITVALFSALYLYFGSTFIHDGSSSPISPPQYIDPYELLEDERISQIAPRVSKTKNGSSIDICFLITLLDNGSCEANNWPHKWTNHGNHPFIILTLGRLGTDFFIILLKGSEILTGFRELSFLHTLTHIPVHKGTLGIHQVKLVVNSGEHLSNAGRVGDHAHSPLNLGEVTSWDNSGWLVVDTALESGRAPVYKLNGALGLDGGNSSIHILGHNITTVHEAASHVFAVARVTLGHHRRGLKCTVGDFSH
ncbi:hypothetical protein Prudu_022311 [Prunus dulcis]|uniref:Uncharacterized protein n=1 Tax=Prunus dulcis TaxID=3755 RepID=A0A4Y1RZ79_PRUDU|nr:hypothetical protein Prudu_022311 [Prunus dulcis]